MSVVGERTARIANRQYATELAEIGTWISSGASGLWAEVITYRWPLLWVTLLELLARLQSFTATLYSIDGYQPATYSLYFRDGRWGLAVLYWLREQLGYSGIPVVPSSMVLAAILFSGAGFLFVRFMLGRPSSVALFIFVSLYTLHPFNTEMYTFSDVTLVSAISTFLAAAGLACCGASSRPWLGAVLGFLLMSFALAINQLLAADIVVIALFALVVRMCRKQQVLFESADTRLLSSPVRALFVTIAGVVIYFVTVVLLPILLHTSLGRVDQRQTIDVGQKLTAFRIAFEKLLLPLPGFTTVPASEIAIALILFGAVVIFATVLRRRGVALAIAALMLVAAAAVCSVAVPVAAKDIWLVPRLLATFSLVSAGVVTIGWSFAQQAWARRPVTVALVALIAGYIGTSNSILYDQHRVNFWDMQEANRIIARFELDPNFSKMRSLAIMYAFWSHPIALTTAYGDLNISALYPPWSKIGVVEESTGLQFQEPTSVELQTAAKFCAAADIWPSAGSTTISGELGIVCLGHDPTKAVPSSHK